MAGLAQLAGWLLGFSLLFGVILWLVGLLRWLAGGDARPALLWGTVFLLVGAGGYGVVLWFFEGGQPGAVEARFVVVPADYYWERGVPMEVARYFPVEVTVVPLIPAFEYYTVEVDWGDGSPPSQWPPLGAGRPGEPAVLRHSYHDLGVYTVTVTIRYYRVVNLTDYWWGGGGLEEAVVERWFSVNVTAPWYEYAEAAKAFIATIPEEGGLAGYVARALKWTGERLADAFASIVDMLARWMAALGLNAGYAYYYYVSMPTSGNFPALERVYGLSQTWALYLAPVAFVASLLWRGFWEWERGGDALLDAFRDLIAVSIGVYLFLDAYDLLAGLVNVVSLSVAQLGQLGALYSMVVATAALLSVAGLFAPGPGALAALVFALLLGMVLVGALKWLLAAAIVAAMPVLLVLWLVPGLRPAVSAALHLLAGLFVFTIVAAVLSALVSQMALTLTETQEGRSLLFAVLVPLIFAAATPMIANQVAGSLGFAPTAALSLLKGGGPAQPPTIQAVPAAAAAGAAGVVVMAGNRPVSGTVLGRAPSPLAPAPAAAPAVRPLPLPAPPAPRQPTTAPATPGPAQAAKPEIRELPRGPRAVPQRLRELADVARGRLDVDASQAGPGARAAYAAARAAGRLAGYAARELRAFDNELARRTGVTPVKAAERAVKATIKTAEAGYKAVSKAASWVAPYAVRLGERARTWYNENVRVWEGFRQGRGLVVEFR